MKALYTALALSLTGCGGSLYDGGWPVADDYQPTPIRSHEEKPCTDRERKSYDRKSCADDIFNQIHDRAQGGQE
jgi:hypothetical protein